MKLNLKQLMTQEVLEGLEVVPDEVFQKHYGKGKHYITRAKPGFKLMLTDLCGKQPASIARVGMLHWCTSTKKEGLRCDDRAFWTYQTPNPDRFYNHDGFMVNEDDEPVFEVTNDGAK